MSETLLSNAVSSILLNYSKMTSDEGICFKLSISDFGCFLEHQTPFLILIKQSLQLFDCALGVACFRTSEKIWTPYRFIKNLFTSKLQRLMWSSLWVVLYLKAISCNIYTGRHTDVTLKRHTRIIKHLQWPGSHCYYRRTG